MDKAEILEELKRRAEEEKYRQFVPNGRQREFVELFAGSGNFVDIFSGGNGAGKTFVMVNLLAHLMWEPGNEWFKRGVLAKWPYPKRVRIGTESENVKEGGSIDQAIHEWWPKGRYEALKGGKTYVSQYRTDTGWVVDKMSYEQEAREWESATLGLAMFDEPPPRDKYGATVSRMRRGGKIGIFMTPLMQSAWIMDELVGGESKCGIVYADLEDNCREHGVRGTLDHKHIETMIEHMDPDEIEARVHGRAMHLTNVILGKSFDRGKHLVEDDLEAPAGAQWFHVVDPARGKPWAMAWGWVDRAGNHVFDSEYPGTDWIRTRETSMALKDYADLIRQVDGGKVSWRILDRHFGNSRNDYGTTLKMDLEDKFGIEFMDSYNCENEVETGIVKVKDLLRGDGLGPRLKFKKRCRNIIRSLERWDRDPLTWKPKENSLYKDHFDLVRYVAMANLEPYQVREFTPRSIAYVVGR